MKGVAKAVPVIMLVFVMTAQGVLVPGTPTTTATTTYGGRAFDAYTNVPLLGETYFGDTGNLAADGGVLVADFSKVGSAVANAAGFLAYTRGFNTVGMSEVATSDVDLLAGTPAEVVASFTYARTVAVCDGVSAAGDIPDLTVAGVTVSVTGDPNQMYSIPGVLSLIINEQIDGSSGTFQSITRNALHLWALGVEVIVSSAHSELTCGAPASPIYILSMGTHGNSVGTLSVGGPIVQWVPPSDFMTGGGYFFASNNVPKVPGSMCLGSRVNFGFNAGPRPGQPTVVKGHLNLIDHSCDHHLDGTDVTDYFRASEAGNTDPQDVCRLFSGPATFDGQSGHRYMAGGCDYGEPGRYDRFRVLVFDANGNVVYIADNARAACPEGKPLCGDLPGGNIQLHRF